jgi:undecaprenyl-diphosphatase
LIVIFGGNLTRTKTLDIGDAIFFSSIGAIIGDIIGYVLGKKYGKALIVKYGKYFFFKPEYLDKTSELIRNHPGKTLIIGRFNSISRAFAPFAAGVAKLPLKKFLLYNIIGGICWGSISIMVGYFFGASFEVGARLFGKFLIIGISIIVALILIYNFINKRQRIFKKYHLYTLGLSIISIFIFSKMAEDIIEKELIINLDVYINNHIPFLWNSSLTHIMLFFTTIGSPLVLSIISGVLFIILLSKKKWNAMILFLISMVSGLILGPVLKWIFHRPRPVFGSLIHESSWSFPSAHAVMATIFFSVLIYTAKNNIQNTFVKKLLITLSVIFFLMISASRIYLGVHWFSDVIAGISLGVFIVTIIILILYFIRFIIKSGYEGFKIFYKRLG